MAFATRRTSIANPAHRKRKMCAKQIRIFGTKRQKAALRAKRRHNAPRKVSHRTAHLSTHGETQFRRVSFTHAGQSHQSGVERKGNGQTKQKTQERSRSRPASSAPVHRTQSRPSPGTHQTLQAARSAPLQPPQAQSHGHGMGRADHLCALHHRRSRGVEARRASRPGNQEHRFPGLRRKPGRRRRPGLDCQRRAQERPGGPRSLRRVRGPGGSADSSPITPRLGQYTSQLGMGDYLVSNWVNPQRYVDALHSAQVQIPGGWAPTTVIQSAAPPVAAGRHERPLRGRGKPVLRLHATSAGA